MKLRLGFSPCPNDTFLFDALVHRRVADPGLEFDVVLADVEELNERALAGDLELTKLSYAAFARVIDRYGLLRAGSALGRGCGPLLIAREPIAMPALADATVAIPGELTTANFLLGLAVPDIGQRLPMRFDLIEDAVLEGRVDAGLIIHENRFTYADRGLVALRDLGAYWEETFGLPIPLGGIFARRDLDPGVVARVDALIRASVEHAFARPEDSAAYVRAHAQAMDEAVMREHIALYVNDFTVDLGAEGVAAVEKLFAVGRERGLVTRTEPLFAC